MDWSKMMPHLPQKELGLKLAGHGSAWLQCCQSNGWTPLKFRSKAVVYNRDQVGIQHTFQPSPIFRSTAVQGAKIGLFGMCASDFP